MNEVITWEAIDAELNKGEQMGYQTVLQLAKVGQMLIEKMGDMPIREFVQRAGQSIPRLTRSTCHNYMMLAKYRPLLEQRKPDSQRAALALIADSKAPPRATPAPTPATPQATPQQPKSPVPDKWAAADDAFNKYLTATFAHFEQLLKAGEMYHELFSSEGFDDMSEFLEHAAEKTGADESDIEFAMTLAEKFESLRGRLTVSPVPAPKERDADAEFILDRLASAERLELEALNEYAKSI